MLDFCSVLFVAAIVVGIVTAFGHGIWLLVAAVFRAMFASSPEQTTRCFRCGRSLFTGYGRCPHCGLERDSTLSAELADLAAMRRQAGPFGGKRRVGARTAEAGIPADMGPSAATVGPPKTQPAPAIPVAPLVPVFRAVEVPLGVPQSAEEVLDVIPVLEAAPEPATPSVRPIEPRPAPMRVEVVPAPNPRRSFGEVLSSFMEERNILWGELIGGLLIVGCSIALVISLWHQLERVPYFPFLVLAGITAALIGAGLYTLHHWKLESTSRGLLVIGTLLVPLSFMVLAERGAEGGRLLEISVTAASLALFAFLLQRAGRVLSPDQSGLLPLAVLGAAASQLLIPWLLAKHQPVLGPILFLGALPMLCQSRDDGAGAAPSRPARSDRAFAFARSVWLARHGDFLLRRGNGLPGLLERQPGFCPSAPGRGDGGRQHRTPGMRCLGLSPLDRRTATGDGPHHRHRDCFGWCVRHAGGGGAGWPRPFALAVVCGLNFAALTIVAFHYRMQVAHAVALPCLALGYLTTWHALAGHLTADSSGWTLLYALGSAQSGTVLAVMVVLLGVAAELLARMGQRQSSASYALGSGIAALVSLALVSARGFAEPMQPMMIYALYGAGTLALNRVIRKPDVNYLGLGLLVGATIWGLQWQVPGRMALWGMVLALEAMALAGFAVYVTVRNFNDEAYAPSPWLPVLGSACRDTAAVVAVLALAAARSAAEFPGPALQAYTAAILAAAALCLSLVLSARMADMDWYTTAFRQPVSCVFLERRRPTLAARPGLCPADSHLRAAARQPGFANGPDLAALPDADRNFGSNLWFGNGADATNRMGEQSSPLDLGACVAGRRFPFSGARDRRADLSRDGGLVGLPAGRAAGLDGPGTNSDFISMVQWAGHSCPAFERPGNSVRPTEPSNRFAARHFCSFGHDALAVADGRVPNSDARLGGLRLRLDAG